MTLPDERLRSLVEARELLGGLISPLRLTSIPEDIARRARQVLRHYPTVEMLENIAAHVPELLSGVAAEYGSAQRDRL